MHKARILLILGVWLVILPYLGFPYSWKNTLLSLSGLALVYFSYTFYLESKEGRKQEKYFDNFSENNNFDKNNEEIEVVADDMSDSVGLNSEE